MTVRIGANWQTLFADLSIILFMVTVAALSRSSDAPVPQIATPAAAPVALYRAGRGSPSLKQWLAVQAPDSRQRLSIVVSYSGGGQAAAMERAADLLRQAGTAGANARLVIEPGANDATASLTFDAALAQGLLSQQGKEETLP